MILSVVIPCFNHGQYLQETIDSVLSYQDQPIEIIIVDDGSDDSFTKVKIEELKNLGYNVIQQINSGLAKTRNIGIASAKGKYILPLDADNKIRADYIRNAIKLLDADFTDIVYAKPSFFGEVIKEREFETHKFDGTKLIFENYIDACAIFRKNVWIKNEGYDEKMPYQGLEDWDFWLKSYFNKFRFHFINEELYEYRILSNSMITSIGSLDTDNSTLNYIINKYGILFIENLRPHYVASKMYENDIRHPFRSIFKYIFRSVKALIER